jgi:YebC/PmpR family DNA-binding regulatory protein
MAGHSKWANIKHRKAAQDARRSKIWTRIIKDLTIAARDGGPDPASNPALRLAIQNAKGANMPKENVERAIKKGSGGEAAHLQELTYEGYGPGGVGIFIEATTDNLNRTVANVRLYFSKGGGSLGTNGSLSFVFTRKGIFEIPLSEISQHNPEELELALIEGGAEDMQFTDEILIITTGFEDYGSMQHTLAGLNILPTNTQLQRIPLNTVKPELEDAKKVLTLIDKLEEDEDISSVYHNLELTDELADSLQ